ncbi:hypothetical protein BCD67_23690 [Oscillatoriales cyanobacterium USR001]|nr:hypothetical protein BCD67_23690 [Oscillatoriales cyanobacterium USR001]
MAESCTTVTPGQPLAPLQKIGLELVARLHGGHDVVLAIDLTESVGLNDEGRIRLRQIVEDSLQLGDTVYVVPFATTVNPLAANVNPLLAENSIKFNGKKDIDLILQAIPFQPNISFQKTDIQQAELTIYQGLAALNQCRLGQHQPIKSQSVVWITDAPLFTKSPASSTEWVETPADSLFRVANSEVSQLRQTWFQVLPWRERSLTIKTKDNKQYKLSVVDISPNIQEFCTPAPGGRETCLVSAYLFNQLWLPLSISGIFLAAVVVAGIRFSQQQQKWKLAVDLTATPQKEDQVCYLGNNQRIAIGEIDSSCADSIDTPGPEVRGYLLRKGGKLYLDPTGEAAIFLNGKEITNRTLITNTKRIRLNCPDSRKREYEIIIEIKK